MYRTVLWFVGLLLLATLASSRSPRRSGIFSRHQDGCLLQTTQSKERVHTVDPAIGPDAVSEHRQQAWLQMLQQLQAVGSELPSNQSNASKKMLVAYLSGVDYYERRRSVRSNCLPEIRESGLDVKFFIGRPSFITAGSHAAQGALATAKEFETAKMLATEVSLHGDIQLVPFRDLYRDLSDKITGIMQYAIRNGYHSVLKIDDDNCPNMTAVLRAADMARPSTALYGGKYLFNGTEYNTMRGKDGTTAPFFSGVCYVLSAALAKSIFEEDLAHTLLFATYGTDSDDANVGKWYDYSKKHHNGSLSFKLKKFPNLCKAQKPSSSSTSSSTSSPSVQGTGNTEDLVVEPASSLTSAVVK